MSEAVKCRGCGRMIRYIQTEYGRRLPCRSESLWVIPDAAGSTYYDESGHAVKGYEVREKRFGAVIAYAPHRGSCPYAAYPSRAALYNERERAFREKAQKEREAREAREARRREKEERLAAEEAARREQYSLFAGL